MDVGYRMASAPPYNGGFATQMVPGKGVHSPIQDPSVLV